MARNLSGGLVHELPAKLVAALTETQELLEGPRRPCCWAGCVHRTDKKPGKWQQEVLLGKRATK